MSRNILIASFLVLVAALGAAPGPAAAQGVDVALLPAETNLGHGIQFDVDVTIPGTSSEFNAFELVVEFDDSLLTLVSHQEGALVTGACGNRFHNFNESEGVISVTDGLLCAGVKVSGPGVIYRLRFETRSTPANTWIQILSAGFSNAGINVTPVTTADALVRIGDVTGIPGDDRTGRAILHSPYPNPFSRSVTLGFTSEEEGPVRLDIYSISGRMVRRLVDDGAASGNRTVLWDGRDDRGLSVSPGIYMVRMVATKRISAHRLVKIDQGR